MVQLTILPVLPLSNACDVFVDDKSAEFCDEAADPMANKNTTQFIHTSTLKRFEVIRSVKTHKYSEYTAINWTTNKKAALLN